jgi:hypothetical protein
MITQLSQGDSLDRLLAARKLYSFSCGLVGDEVSAAAPALRAALSDDYSNLRFDEFSVGKLAAMALDRIEQRAERQGKGIR